MLTTSSTVFDNGRRGGLKGNSRSVTTAKASAVKKPAVTTKQEAQATGGGRAAAAAAAVKIEATARPCEPPLANRAAQSGNARLGGRPLTALRHEIGLALE